MVFLSTKRAYTSSTKAVNIILKTSLKYLKTVFRYLPRQKNSLNSTISSHFYPTYHSVEIFNGFASLYPFSSSIICWRISGKIFAQIRQLLWVLVSANLQWLFTSITIHSIGSIGLIFVAYIMIQRKRSLSKYSQARNNSFTKVCSITCWTTSVI